jgi:hypothetical protein
MSLSPWLQPSAINSPLQAAGSLGFGGYDNKNSLDKRKNGDPMGTRNKINEYKSVADTITNALGSRSPYFKIGEIPADNWMNRNKIADYAGQFGGFIRAVTDLIDSPTQEGVIIDCLGDVNGKIDIELTSNPILFSGSKVTDGRLRKPTIVKAVIAVSNYNNDDVIGFATDVLSALDPTGITGTATKMFLENGNTRAQNALYKLRWLQENGQPFKVYTPHGLYENMVITTIEPVTNAGTMDMLFANITFTEIIYAMPYFDDEKNAANMPVRENVLEEKGIGSEYSSVKNRVQSWLKE